MSGITQQCISNEEHVSFICVGLAQDQCAGNTNWVEIVGEKLQVDYVTDGQGNAYMADAGPGPDPSIISQEWDRYWYVARNISGGGNAIAAAVSSPGVVRLTVTEYPV